MAGRREIAKLAAGPSFSAAQGPPEQERQVRMDMFDMLSAPIREVIASADCLFEVAPVLGEWGRLKRRGWSAARFAARLRKLADEEREVRQRELEVGG